MQVNAHLVELPALFKSVVKKVTQEWNCKVQDKLTLSQFRMLYLLHHQGLSKPNELAEKMIVTPGAITGIADKLIERGLVARIRDSEDRRVVHLVITEDGIRLITSMLEKQQATIVALFDRLPEEDIAHLKRIFTVLLESMDSEEE
ncbi:MarR family winged helix-turn-helix transcriptional regulator [Paenibacillus sp. GCM10027626]|uniref:MarR family winged helix-turn-helix transcriptional regulator n=1 Tax=Paenibacillus sp. GCM10027626 TaxID=3273411 RepID=UPI00362D9502